MFDVCIIGAGPAGLALASSLLSRGLSVRLIDSGGAQTGPDVHDLAAATLDTPQAHSPMRDAVWRGLGGTSAIWGGRCVPLDAIDFVPRAAVNGEGWPFDHATLAAYLPAACEFLGIGKAHFEVAQCEGLPSADRPLSEFFKDSEALLASQLERWTPLPNMWARHGAQLAAQPGLSIETGLTCVGFEHPAIDAPVRCALFRDSRGQDATCHRIEARVFVVACGGVESTRLLLNSLAAPEGLKLAGAAWVGRGYMGHPSGKIADILLRGQARHTLFGFERDGEVYVRRRITFPAAVLERERLLNIAFWLDNPPLADWRHHSAVLSAAYLALTLPGLGPLLAPAAIRKRIQGDLPIRRGRHLLNCLRQPFAALAFCARFAWQRYLAPVRLPGFFTASPANRYALHYHAEQAPSVESCIRLDEARDALGQPRARIALRWGAGDVDSIVRAHQLLDRALREEGIGELVYRFPHAALANAIRAQAVDGYHQIGTLRMGRLAAVSVTDPWGVAWGAPNLYVASSAVFPTSGQANPTLSLVALALRQAEKIASHRG